MKDRIIQFIEEEKLTPAEFADKIGVQRSSVSHVLNGRNNPGFSFIQKILEAFPLLNSRWLLTGSGSMSDGKPITEVVSSPDLGLFSTGPVDIDDSQKTNTDMASKGKPTAIKENNVKQENNTISIATRRKVTKVLIFYDDHSFEDFHPAE